MGYLTCDILCMLDILQMTYFVLVGYFTHEIFYTCGIFTHTTFWTCEILVHCTEYCFHLWDILHFWDILQIRHFELVIDLHRWYFKRQIFYTSDDFMTALLLFCYFLFVDYLHLWHNLQLNPVLEYFICFIAFKTLLVYITSLLQTNISCVFSSSLKWNHSHL